MAIRHAIDLRGNSPRHRRCPAFQRLRRGFLSLRRIEKLKPPTIYPLAFGNSTVGYEQLLIYRF